jgi:hypothetical protein
MILRISLPQLEACRLRSYKGLMWKFYVSLYGLHLFSLVFCAVFKLHIIISYWSKDTRRLKVVTIPIPQIMNSFLTEYSQGNKYSNPLSTAGVYSENIAVGKTGALSKCGVKGNAPVVTFIGLWTNMLCMFSLNAEIVTLDVKLKSVTKHTRRWYSGRQRTDFRRHSSTAPNKLNLLVREFRLVLRVYTNYKPVNT